MSNPETKAEITGSFDYCPNEIRDFEHANGNVPRDEEFVITEELETRCDLNCPGPILCTPTQSILDRLLDGKAEPRLVCPKDLQP